MINSYLTRSWLVSRPWTRAARGYRDTVAARPNIRALLPTVALLALVLPSATLANGVNGFTIGFTLSTQNDQNEASSTVLIEVVEGGVASSFAPVIATPYTFDLTMLGDFFQVTVTGNSASGATESDAGSNFLASGVTADAIVAASPTLAGFALSSSWTGTADSDGNDAISQAQRALTSYVPAIPSASGFARSDTIQGDSKDFVDQGTKGASVESLFVNQAPGNFFTDLNSDGQEDAPGAYRIFILSQTNTSSAYVSSTGFTQSVVRIELTAVPVPGALGLLAGGLAILAVRVSRRRSPA